MNNRCRFCGGYGLISDRALAGKLICRKCGRPSDNSFYNNSHINVFENKRVKYLLIFLIVFIIIILFT